MAAVTDFPEQQLRDIALRFYGLDSLQTIKQIYKSAWLINDAFVLKKNSNRHEVKKALTINNFLTAERVPVTEYIPTTSGESFVTYEDNTYTLMRKMKGRHIDPLAGNYIDTAHNIGIEVARLHKALRKMDNLVNVSKTDLIDELNGWVLTEIKSKNIEVPNQIIESCISFDRDYHLLPRQIIHRDIQFGNMLFENDKLSGFLDFDIAQENARIFDIVYLIQSILVDKYNDPDIVKRWRDFTKSLLSSYHSENQLFENEVQAIYKISLAIQLIFVSFFSSIYQLDLVPKCVNMAKWVFSNEDIFAFSMPSG